MSIKLELHAFNSTINVQYFAIVMHNPSTILDKN